MEAMGALVNVSCRAVLFDMDVTLVDSTSVVELAWAAGPRGMTSPCKRSSRSHMDVRRSPRWSTFFPGGTYGRAEGDGALRGDGTRRHRGCARGHASRACAAEPSRGNCDFGVEDAGGGAYRRRRLAPSERDRDRG